jgi:hypothetical protein
MNKCNVLVLLLACAMSNISCMDTQPLITQANVDMLRNLSASIQASDNDEHEPYLTNLANVFKLVTKFQKKDPNFGFNYADGVLTRLTDDAPNAPRRQGLELVERILKQHVLMPLLFERPKYFKNCQVGVSYTLIEYFVNCCPNLYNDLRSRMFFHDLAAYCFMGDFSVYENFPRNTEDKQNPVLNEVEHLKDLVAPNRVATLVRRVTPVKVGIGVAIIAACCAVGYGVYLYCRADEKAEAELQENEHGTADTVEPLDA